VDLVEAYREWTVLLENMAKNKCHGCVKLEEHIKLVKEIKKHSEEVDALKFQMSDEALQQMPDFQGRVCLRDTNLSCQYFDLVVV
jgi:antiviral helicase SKI2